MTNSKATFSDIRAFYRADGREVRISRNGHVTFRDRGETQWREGRWVSEYVVRDGQVVIQ